MRKSSGGADIVIGTVVTAVAAMVLFVPTTAALGLLPCLVGWLAWSVSGVGESLFSGILPEQFLSPSFMEIYCVYLASVTVRCASGRAIRVGKDYGD